MSFDQLFRSSKFVSLYPGQILYAPKYLRTHGEFGIKHSLPPSGPRNFQLERVDDAMVSKPKLKSARNQLYQIDLLKSISTVHEIPKARSMAKKSLSGKKDLTELNGKEWMDTVALARLKKEEFLSGVKSGKIRKENWNAFLGVKTSKDHDDSIPVHPYSYHISSSENIKPVTVQGRILNPVKGGFAVGVCGIVAFLPQSEANLEKLSKYALYKTKTTETNGKYGKSPYASIDREILVPLYVLEARWDEQGRPELILSTNEPTRTSIQTRMKSSSVDTRKVASILDLLNAIDLNSKK